MSEYRYLYDRMADKIAAVFLILVGVLAVSFVVGMGYVVVHLAIKYW